MATNSGVVGKGEVESTDQRTEASLLLASPQPLPLLSPASPTGPVKCYTADQKKITKTKEELKLTSLCSKPQATICIPKMVESKLYLRPHIIREGESSCLETSLETHIVGKLHLNAIINKSQYCDITVATTVTEHRSGLVLARYTNKRPFTIPEEGYANYEWKLISNEELKKCSTDKVDIRIELFLRVRDWNEFESEETEDNFILIRRS